MEQIADVLVPQIMKQRFNEVIKMIFPERVSERTVGLSDVVPVYPIMEELMNVIQKWCLWDESRSDGGALLKQMVDVHSPQTQDRILQYIVSKLIETRCTAHCSFNRVQVQTLPTEQAAPVLTDSFSQGL